MSAKSSSRPGDVQPIEWQAQPLAHVPKTPLPLVRELFGTEALSAWHKAGGDVGLLMDSR